MIRLIIAAVFAVTVAWPNQKTENAPVFEQVSDHCFFMQLGSNGKNIAAVITEQGALLVNPPDGPDLATALGALENITYGKVKSSPEVRWVAITDHHFFANSGTRYFAEGGAVLLASTKLYALATPESVADFWNPATFMPELQFEGSAEVRPLTWFLFDSQMHLFPENLEIRILALEHKARTGGDVVVFVPEEEVLIVGDLYQKGCFPDIDTDSEGDALEWIAGLKQVIEAVPLFKQAIKPETPEEESEPDLEGPPEEKTLEEQVIVLSSRGEASNLQDMKDLLEISQKLQRDLSRAVKSGRKIESFLKSSAAGNYQSYSNLDSYATKLYEVLSLK
jgi:glyoxylase-like metal-dependent hydrolase (beta-lactamase superfamily II)